MLRLTHGIQVSEKIAGRVLPDSTQYMYISTELLLSMSFLVFAEFWSCCSTCCSSAFTKGLTCSGTPATKERAGGIVAV